MNNLLSSFEKPLVPSTPSRIGDAPIRFDNIEERVKLFSQVYQIMPNIDNLYGMRSPHLFLLWNALTQLEPSIIIESGVYKGLGTWWIERACPSAKIYCIDLDYTNIEYKSPNATYLFNDFSEHLWNDIDKMDTLIVFDDHQNALTRLMQMKWMGFKKAIFDDNYSPFTGDCYSCKKILAGTGNQVAWDTIAPNTFDKKFFLDNIRSYQEFPAPFRKNKTRFGFDWTEQYLFTKSENDSIMKKILFNEASTYTYMCYVELL